MQSGSFSGSIDQVVKLLTRMEDKKLSKERERERERENHNNFHHRAPAEEWEGACQKPKENLRDHEAGAKKKPFFLSSSAFTSQESNQNEGK